LSAEKDTSRAAWLTALAFAMFRLWYVSRIQLSPDEAYYWEWSRNPDLSYYDQGPMLALAIRLGTMLFGVSELGVRIFSVLPSLDTPVCDAQAKRFNEAAGSLPGVDIYTVRKDLSFSQNCSCGAFAVDIIKMLSDHKDGSFGFRDHSGRSSSRIRPVDASKSP